jgi:ABC-type multidrug transport system fused ATPase/permease subunit
MRLPRIRTILLVVGVLAVAAALLAPPLLAPEGWDGVVLAAEAAPAAAEPGGLLTAVMGLVATVVAGVLVWAGTLLAKKLGLELSAEKQEALRKAARDAVFMAEEWGAKRAKLNELTVSGSDKLQQAVGFVLAKIPGVDVDEVKQQIHAALGSVQGLGASKTTGASTSG